MAMYPSFIPTELKVPEEIFETLTLVNKEHLASIMDIAFLTQFRYDF